MAEEKLKAVIEVEVDEASAAKAEKKLKEMGEKTSKATGNNSKASQAASESIKSLQNTIQQVRNLQIVDLVTEHLDQIKKYTDTVVASTASVVDSMARTVGASLKGLGKLFDFKTLKNDGFKAYLNGIGDSLKKVKMWLKSTRTELKFFIGEFKSGMKAAFQSAAFGVGVLVAELVALVGAIKNTLTIARQLKVTLTEASKIGLNVKEYQEWEHVLGHVGIGVDKLSDFMKTLAAEQNAVRDGDEKVIESFKRLGISAEEAANSTQAELFRKTITGLQQLDSEIERTSIAYRIFGEDDAASLIPILKMTNQEMTQLVNNFYLLGGAASDSLTQKTTILSSAVQNLKTAWMGLRNTLAEAIMPAVTAVVNALTKAIAIINMFVRAVFGFEIVSGKSGSTGGVNKATTGIKNYASGAKEATKAVEKLKRTTMGFDELNIVANPNSKSGSADSGAGDIGAGDMGFDAGGGATGFDLSGVSAMSEKMSASLEKWRARIEEWKDTIRALVPIALIGVGVVGGVLAALSGNWPLAIALFALAGVGLYAMVAGEGGLKGYADAFTNACKGLLAPAMIAAGLVGGVIALLCGNVPVAIGLFAMAGFGIAMVSLSEGGWKSFIDNLKRLFSGLGEFFVGLWDKIVGIFKWAWEGIKGVFVGVAEWFGSIFRAAWEAVKLAWSLSIQYYRDIWTGIKNAFVTTVQWFGDLFKKAWEAVKLAWSLAIQYYRDIWTGIKDALSTVIQWFGDTFTKAWNAVKLAWSLSIQYYKDVWTGIKNAFVNTVNYFGNTFSSAWNAVANTWNKAVGYFQGIWNAIKKVFNDASGAIGKAVSETFARAVNWVLENAISKINGFIKTINKAISIINKIPGVSINKLSELDIPRLAKGGIATSSTIANIGEAGKEAILPLENNTGWMDTLADKIAARNGGAPTQIILTLDGRELGKATVKAINDITKTTGNLPLVLG